MYIIIPTVIVLLVVLLVVKATKDSAKDREQIRQRGGMRTVYATLINGILEYPSAKIEDDEGNRVVISGTFTGDDGSDHGTWSLLVKHAYKVVIIDYTTKIYFNDVVQGNKRWEFPADANQNEILHTVKEKMEETKGLRN